MACDLSRLDLLAIQIDGIHIADDLVLLAAVGVDGVGGQHPLAVIEGAAENAAVAQALLDNPGLRRGRLVWDFGCQGRHQSRP